MKSDSLSLRSDFTIGFLGGGQLARMSALQAFRFGMRVACYANREKGEPLQWMTPLGGHGAFDDVAAMTRFAEGCDVVTLENEFIDPEVLRQVEQASGVPVLPGPGSFERIENKRVEKETFRAAGIPVAEFAVVAGVDEVEEFAGRHGWPVVLKSSKGGYDGYGNRVVRNRAEAEAGHAELGGARGHEILVEAFIPFERELAVQVARNRLGTVVYPCCQTIQENQICVGVLAPAPVDPAIRRRAEELAVAAMEAVDGVGLFAFEFFLSADGELLLNESAPRPHNSGHYTIEACVCSQFENHVRAVTGLPLGATRMRGAAAVMVNLLGTHARSTLAEGTSEVQRTEDAHLHLYGKADSRPGRKMGHLTRLAPPGTADVERLYRETVELARGIRI